jgi:hypothetical protein
VEFYIRAITGGSDAAFEIKGIEKRDNIDRRYKTDNQFVCLPKSILQAANSAEFGSRIRWGCKSAMHLWRGNEKTLRNSAARDTDQS